MFYLIRHGEAFYDEVREIFGGLGENFAPLTEKGVEQIKKTSRDERLKGAELIISSPYTRALQSAAILSRELNTEIKVEPQLHEWTADKSGVWIDDVEAENACKEFSTYWGDYPEGETRRWENNEMLRIRLLSVLEKYKDYEKVIVTCHAMLMYPMNNRNWAANGEIVELDLEDIYEKN